MILPLIVVHAIINPSFARSMEIFGLPLRQDGAIYAALVGLRMALLFAVVGIWLGLARNVTFALVAGSRVPAVFGFTLLQALSLTKVLTRRVTSIRLAQQSRGVLRDGGLAQRTSGAIAMVVPLIATTLMDAHDRGDALARMGMGVVRIRAPHPVPPLLRFDMILACAVGAIALVVLLCAILNAN
jgi:energy-coupling factor transporter transmembrane protein EcfT